MTCSELTFQRQNHPTQGPHPSYLLFCNLTLQTTIPLPYPPKGQDQTTRGSPVPQSPEIIQTNQPFTINSMMAAPALWSALPLPPGPPSASQAAPSASQCPLL